MGDQKPTELQRAELLGREWRYADVGRGQETGNLVMRDAARELDGVAEAGIPLRPRGPPSNAARGRCR